MLTPNEEAVLATLPWIGSQLRLRSLTSEDAELYSRVESDPQVMRHLGGVKNNSLEVLRDGIAGGRALMPSMMVVERLSDRAELGYAALFENEAIGRGESDMLVALLPDYQRKGYGREVLELMRETWLRILRRSHCTVTVSPRNMASITLLGRCGFAHVGECETKAGKYYIYRYER